MICTGNICRSPIAEGVLRQRAQKEQISHRMFIHSAGTHAVVGSGASRFGVEVMAQHRIDMRNHVAKQVTYEHVAQATFILVMEEFHRSTLFQLAPEHIQKIMMLSELSGRHYDIPDPIGGPRAAYLTSFAQISGIINSGWDKIIGAMAL